MAVVTAVGGHLEALYSLAVIQFNGSGGGKDDRDLRELGHYLQDSYDVRRSMLDERRLLIQANAREL